MVDTTLATSVIGFAQVVFNIAQSVL